MSANAESEVEIVLSEFDETLTEDEISEIIGRIRNPANNKIIFKMELRDIVNSTWECDIAFTWMALLVFLEGIYCFCDSCNYEIEWTGVPVATILAVPKDREEIVCLIETVMFPCWNVREMDSEQYWERAWGLHHKIVNGQPLNFPRLGDDYMANLGVPHFG